MGLSWDPKHNVCGWGAKVMGVGGGGVPGVSGCQNYGRRWVPNVMGSGGVLSMMGGVGFQE